MNLMAAVASASARWRGRPVRWPVLALCGVALAGCNVLQTVYNQAPRYVQWRTNAAHHFSEGQYELAQVAIRRWFDWQRAEQMSDVAAMLRVAALDVKGPITPALACERRETGLRLIKEAVAAAAPLAAAVIVELEPAQTRQVQAFFQEKNDDFKDDFISPDPQVQAQLAMKFLEKWSSLIYGDFTPAQRLQWTHDIQTLPFDAGTILQEFQRFQGRYVQLLKDTQAQKLSVAHVSQRLQAMVVDGLDPQEPVRKAQMQKWVQAGCSFAATMQNQTTPAQRERASRQLFGWQADVVEIASSR